MGVILLGVGALGANCEPSPPACGRSRAPDCKALGQITACINHCRTPVPDGLLCALDPCDLYTGAGIPNAGVCGDWSACRRVGGSASRVGICTPLAATAPGCAITSNAATWNTGDQDECPYGGYCAALGANAGACDPANAAQNGLPGMCRRYQRVGQTCSGRGANASPGPDGEPIPGLPQYPSRCEVCEPAARCIAVNRLDPLAPYSEANGDPAPPDWRCVRTCPSGSNDECDCAGSTPNNEVRASSCNGGTCVRPQWCAARGAPCGHALLPAYCFDEEMPPVSNDIACLISCCERGAICSDEGPQSTCLACIEDGTTLTTESRCCITAFFTPNPGGALVGKCNACISGTNLATSQTQCCPGLRFAPVTGTATGTCVTCVPSGQFATASDDCCPGLLFVPSINDPMVMVCGPCRALGETATGTSQCCPGLGLVARRTAESPDADVCAMPCAPCTPPPDPARVGRCATGVPPAVCPQSGVTPPESCIRNTEITETCAVEDSDCDGARFDVADPTMVLGTVCPMGAAVTLPPFAPCGTEGGGNWLPPTWHVPGATSWVELKGHMVCDPASNTIACVAIPGIDYCDRGANCRENCVGTCSDRLVHQDSFGNLVRNDTGAAAMWREAAIRNSDGVQIQWNTSNDATGCIASCLGQACGSGCGPGLQCNGSICGLRDDCEAVAGAGRRPVACWNNQIGPSVHVVGCR